jgi:hypothetical protein
VREHYLSWLLEARPDLVERYATLYPRAYAPAKRQDELSALVRDLVERHGGRSRRPAETRMERPRPPAAAKRPEPSQLQLGM